MWLRSVETTDEKRMVTFQHYAKKGKQDYGTRIYGKLFVQRISKMWVSFEDSRKNSRIFTKKNQPTPENPIANGMQPFVPTEIIGRNR